MRMHLCASVFAVFAVANYFPGDGVLHPRLAAKAAAQGDAALSAEELGDALEHQEEVQKRDHGAQLAHHGSRRWWVSHRVPTHRS